MDTREDIRWQKAQEWKMKQKGAMMAFCNHDCCEHNENCPFYDAEEESWDFEQCFEDRG